MSYMVCHGMKSKAGDVKNIEKHIERKNKDYKNKDIDKSRTHLNYDLHYERYQSYKNRINDRIKEEYTGNRAIRKDAIFMVNFVISSDQEFFKNLSEERQREYFKISYDYLKDYFGEKNVISAKVHLDETTPHMHFSAVPLVDGKLNAKKLMSRNFLRKIQSELPKIFIDNGFEIERGIEGSKRKHIETETYKKELNEQLDKVKFKIEELKKEQSTLELTLRHSRDDLEVVEDINTIEAKKTILGANRTISEYDYQKILISFTKIALEKQKLEKENIFLKKNLEFNSVNINDLQRSIDYLRQSRLKDEKEFKNKLDEYKQKADELNKVIDTNYENIRKELLEEFREKFNGIFTRLSNDLEESKKENEELKIKNRNCDEIIDFRGGIIKNLLKEKEWTREFLEFTGQLKRFEPFMKSKYENEKEDKIYNNSYSYDNFNKKQEKDYGMSL